MFTSFCSGTALIDQRYWQFNYHAPFTKIATFSTVLHCVFDIIKNVRTIFGISDNRLLDVLCDVKTEGKDDVRQKCSKWLWREKSRPGASLLDCQANKGMLVLTYFVIWGGKSFKIQTVILIWDKLCLNLYIRTCPSAVSYCGNASIWMSPSDKLDLLIQFAKYWRQNINLWGKRAHFESYSFSWELSIPMENSRYHCSHTTLLKILLSYQTSSWWSERKKRKSFKIA